MNMFGVTEFDTIRLGLKVYALNCSSEDIPEDTVSILLFASSDIPDNPDAESKIDYSALPDRYSDVVITELIETENYVSPDNFISELAEEYVEEYEEFLQYYQDYVYFPEDPLRCAVESGYADSYFLQKTEKFSDYADCNSDSYVVMSAAYGTIESEECPGNCWYQYSFYNNTDETVSVKTENVVINGISVASKTTLATGMNVMPFSAVNVHDLAFPLYFNKAHWDILGINEIHTLSFDYTVSPSGSENETAYHADIVFDDEAFSCDFSGETVFDNKNVKIISKGLYENAASYIGDYTLMLLVQNDSSDEIYFEIPVENSWSEDVKFFTLNDEAASAFIKTKDTRLKIPAGGTGEYLVYIDAPSLKERGINTITDIRSIKADGIIRDYHERMTEQPEIIIEF